MFKTYIQRYAGVFSLIGILLYNNWLLGFFLNPAAMWAGATTSELGAADQQWAWLFRLLDITAAIFFLLGILAITRIGKRSVIKIVLAAGVITLALSTIIESLARLDCSSALSQICAQEELMKTVSWQHDFHILESVVSYALMSLLPIGALLASAGLKRNQGNRQLKIWSYALLAAMTAWAIEGCIQYHRHAVSFGFEQRIFILFFTIWYLVALRLKTTD